MSNPNSPRRDELIEAAYGYVLDHGITGVSLRPVAEAIGSSTGVLRFLFGSKDGLVRAVLDRARRDELVLLERLPDTATLADIALVTWEYLCDPVNRPALVLWTECYAASLLDPEGPWGDFARSTVDDWLRLLASGQQPRVRRTASGRAQCTMVLALLRGCLLDLLATGDAMRTTKAVQAYLADAER